MTNKSTAGIQSLQQQRLLLQLEYYCDKEAFRKQTEQRGMQRLVKRGDAWFPLRIGKSYYNSLNQLSLEVFRTQDQDISHNFEFGRPVVFFHSGKETTPHTSQPTLHYYSFTATVSYVDGDRMVVTVPDSAPLIDLQGSDAEIGCQLSFDETSYRAMFDALDRTIKAKDNRLAQLRELFHQGKETSAKRLSTYGAQEGASGKEQENTLTPNTHHPTPNTHHPTHISFPWLNPTQEKAVNEVLWAKDVMVVHGPPGTGKTTTLVEAINETLMREPQVMVCAQSNMAVDWISEKLVDRGINVLRIGNPTRVNDKMLSFTYERRFEAHPDYTTLWSIRKAIRDLRGARRKGHGASESYHQKMERLKSRATELELRIKGDIFNQANVIASTLVGADSRLLHGMKFHTLFIDEAAQALEAACWIPIRRVHRVILAGDHCQLPPTVKSIAALKAGLGKTLMEHIVENHPEVVTLLRIQYRMNEQIMRFSSEWFYGGQVESAPQIKYRGILDWDNPIEWRETPPPTPPDGGEHESGAESQEATVNGKPSTVNRYYGEEFVGSTFGRINKGEAEQTLQVLEEYFTKVGKQRILDEQIDVGVISPYRAQVQYLQHLIKKSPFFKPYRRLISVNTVDGFQGQERDIILISLVRSNEDGQIGFLRDLRRMNVAITRARMKLIIMGDVATLTRHPFYKKLWEYVKMINEGR
jgi:hypothetical protein